MQRNGNTKKDRYIEKQKKRLKQARIDILLKTVAAALPLSIVLTVLGGLLYIETPPEKWIRTQITYSHISYEYYYGMFPSGERHKTYVLNTTEGHKYRLNIDDTEKELLEEQLVPYQQYDILFNAFLYKNSVESITYDGDEFMNYDESVRYWEQTHRLAQNILLTMLFLIPVECTLGYLFFCKKERREIKVLKLKIAERLRRTNQSELNANHDSNTAFCKRDSNKK